MTDEEVVAMSEQEVLDVFEKMHLTSDDDRRSMNFDDYDIPEEPRIEIQVLAHTGIEVVEPNLLNA